MCDVHSVPAGITKKNLNSKFKLKLKFDIFWKLFYDAAASGHSCRSKTVIRENKDLHPIVILAAKCFVYSAGNNRPVKTMYAGLG